MLFMLAGGAEARRGGRGSNNTAGGCDKRIDLVPTPEGNADDISGHADVRQRGTQQRFKVSMDARVEDGTTFVVFANGRLAGTITISLGDGELELNNNNGKKLPTGVDPVCSIGAVVVVDENNTTVLEGSF
jgi:hypothetical protein